MVVNALLTTFLCTVALPILLFLLAVKLWEIYTLRCRDPTCPFPLPPGSMGLPFIGETLQLLLQRKTFLRMKREKYGYIYRTHLFGNRTVRVTGADNVKQILLGEHRLVSAQWPASVRAILGTETLSNVHGAQHKTKKKVSYFDLSAEGALATGREMKRLMFRIAMRVLLGFEPEQVQTDEHELVEAFEEMIKNLFSLPIDVPFSGLYRGLKARNFIHSKIEENIKKKVQESDQEWKPRDALQQLIDSSNKNKEPISMQAIKQSATELLFGGHETTASTATSLVMFLGLNPKVVDKLRQELQDEVKLVHRDSMAILPLLVFPGRIPPACLFPHSDNRLSFLQCPVLPPV
uniref:Cytochrome P450, family 26, subfamily A, polypeptide 1 n=1 Tax=Neolamprologus brichardi TaxID=32507 RepID=A0A3Q4I9U5_NEOBR